MGHRHLSEEVRCLILADYAEGLSTKVIAHRWSCSHSYVRALASREGLTNRNRKPPRRRKYYGEYYERNKVRITARVKRKREDDRRRAAGKADCRDSEVSLAGRGDLRE